MRRISAEPVALCGALRPRYSAPSRKASASRSRAPSGTRPALVMAVARSAEPRIFSARPLGCSQNRWRRSALALPWRFFACEVARKKLPPGPWHSASASFSFSRPRMGMGVLSKTPSRLMANSHGAWLVPLALSPVSSLTIRYRCSVGLQTMPEGSGMVVRVSRASGTPMGAGSGPSSGSTATARTSAVKLARDNTEDLPGHQGRGLIELDDSSAAPHRDRG